MNLDRWRELADELIVWWLDLPWLLGDWAIAAEPEQLDVVDERTEVINADTRFEPTELAHFAFVAERFEPDRRRWLPWSYHDAVARLAPSDADTLLELAESESWSLAEIKRAAAAARDNGKG